MKRKKEKGKGGILRAAAERGGGHPVVRGHSCGCGQLLTTWKIVFREAIFSKKSHSGRRQQLKAPFEGGDAVIS